MVNNNIEEVKYAKHTYEFSRFFDKHRYLCDEISGLKDMHYMVKGEQIVFRIKEYNFIKAIRRVQAYIIDFVHYIVSSDDEDMIMEMIDDIENRFLRDKEFSILVSKNNKLQKNDLMKLQKMYYSYLFELYNIVDLLNKSLRSTLIIATKEAQQLVVYREDNEFFTMLSHYRESVTTQLAKFNFQDIHNMFKKVVSYFYTYKFIVPNKETQLILELIQKLKESILSEEITDILLSLNYSLDSRSIENIKEISLVFKKSFMLIYKYVNIGLTKRNILPKAKKKIYFDKTLI